MGNLGTDLDNCASKISQNFVIVGILKKHQFLGYKQCLFCCRVCVVLAFVMGFEVYMIRSSMEVEGLQKRSNMEGSEVTLTQKSAISSCVIIVACCVRLKMSNKVSLLRKAYSRRGVG